MICLCSPNTGQGLTTLADCKGRAFTPQRQLLHTSAKSDLIKQPTVALTYRRAVKIARKCEIMPHKNERRSRKFRPRRTLPQSGNHHAQA